MSATAPIIGKWFEEFSVGQVFESPGRTLTDTDVTIFSMLSGDWNAVHSDDVFAAQTRFGRRIGHGALGIAIATGLMTRMCIFEGTAIAMLDIRNWVFRKPLSIGDTLRLKVEITALELSASGRHGRVDRTLTLINQVDEPIQTGMSAVLISLRPQPLEAQS